MRNAELKNRRQFLIDVGRNVGLASVGGLIWSSFLSGRTAYPAILRPPAALPEDKFLAACTKCGLCVDACPYNSLVLAMPGDGRPVGTPYFSMRDNPCRMCRDIPCAAACPTAALDMRLLSDTGGDGKQARNIDKARIGLAVIDRETCIAHWGIQCDACYRTCPLIDRAITVEYARNDRTGKHAILAPVVHSDRCTGCGMCEHACVTKKASIFVLPRLLAQGESGGRYVRGWKEEDEKRIGEAPEETRTVTPRSEKGVLDYLNREGL